MRAIWSSKIGSSFTNRAMSHAKDSMPQNKVDRRGEGLRGRVGCALVNLGTSPRQYFLSHSPTLLAGPWHGPAMCFVNVGV